MTDTLPFDASQNPAGAAVAGDDEDASQSPYNDAEIWAARLQLSQAQLINHQLDPSNPPVKLPQAEIMAKARHLYWMGWTLSSIARVLLTPRTTVQGWRDAEKWDDSTAIDRINGALEARMVGLVFKEAKSAHDFKEIDLLGRQLERMARVDKFAVTGKEVDLNPNILRRNAAPKKAPKRNHFTPEDLEKLVEAFDAENFGYQRTWWENIQQRTRMILKSRQIGATWYFAREALIDAVQSGRNQIFLSASKAQAHIFRSYIVKFAREVCGVELTGDPIILSNGAELRFLGTNALTAQGFTGNFYFDEFFWTRDFEKLNKVASAMALHKHWRKTYFSTPSSMQHPAYKLWSGERFNKTAAEGKSRKLALDLSHDKLAGGFTGEDKIWRMIVTIMDAIAGGCDLFDLDELRAEYTPEEFDNLLMCLFLDDRMSAFPLSEIQKCMVDSWVDWAADFKPLAAKPFGNREVWVGYDPSHTGDSAGCVVLAPPARPGGKFRVLERTQFKGMSFEDQAAEIKKLTKRFNVSYIGIDSTGLGQGVFQLVKTWFPAVTDIRYSLDNKVALVQKAQAVIRAGRLEFDAGWVDLAHSFLAIQKTLTPSGTRVTFEAGRTEAIGHSDLAWAVMHALINEPLDGGEQASTSVIEVSE